MKNEKEYPYVVIRWMAAVYGEKPIKFIKKGESKYTDDCFTVADSIPFENGNLTLKCKEKLIQLIQKHSRDTKLSMCLVLAKEHAIFIEPNGTVLVSKEPPSGGIRMDNVKSDHPKDN